MERMDHTDWFLGMLVFLVAALVHEVGSGTTPMLIVGPLLVILHGIPIYFGLYALSVLTTDA